MGSGGDLIIIVDTVIIIILFIAAIGTLINGLVL